MSTLDAIQARADEVAHGLIAGRFPSTHKVLASLGDRARLLAALRSVEEWCETNQHPNTDYPQGFSRQDYALDDGARRIRAAIREALN